MRHHCSVNNLLIDFTNTVTTQGISLTAFTRDPLILNATTGDGHMESDILEREIEAQLGRKVP